MPLRRRHRRHAFAVLAAAAAAALTGSLLVAPAAAAPDPSPNGLATPSHPGVVTTTPTLNPTAPFDESQWKQGSLHFNTVFLCIYTCQSYTVAMARVDYQGKPDTHLLTPRVGERFYVHVLTAVVAPFSVSDTYQMQVLLPNGLTPSIQSDTDVQCAITNTSNVQTRLMSASECQDPVQFGLYRQFPPVALAEGEVAHFFFPVVASKAFNGGTDIIQLVANPISNPQTALPDPLVSNNEVFVLPAAAPSTAPGAPTGVSATPGNGSAQVSWNAPGSNGGSAITGYTVTSNPGAKTCTTTGGLSCSVGGLSNGTSYTFTVRATNGVGTGLASGASAAVTPKAVPSPPLSPTATAAQRLGDRQVEHPGQHQRVADHRLHRDGVAGRTHMHDHGRAAVRGHGPDERRRLHLHGACDQCGGQLPVQRCDREGHALDRAGQGAHAARGLPAGEGDDRDLARAGLERRCGAGEVRRALEEGHRHALVGLGLHAAGARAHHHRTAQGRGVRRAGQGGQRPRRRTAAGPALQAHEVAHGRGTHDRDESRG